MRPLRLVAALWFLAAPVAAQTAAAPAAPAADLRKVAALIAKGQLAPAERQLRQILAQGGGAKARGLLGLVLLQRNELEEAEAQFQRALRADPALADVRQHLARLYLAQGKEDQALVELRRAAETAALDRDLALKLAAVEQAAGHPALAERQLRSTIDRFQSVEALLQLARLQSSRRDATGALESLRRARALAPNAEDVLSASAQVALAVRAPVPAILSLEPLTRMCPTVAQYPYLLGVALMQAGDTLAAVDPLQAAQRLEPDRALTLVALGLALNGRKRYGEAKPALLHALQLEPENLEASAALAEAEDGLGELADAEAHAARALAGAPGHPTANLVRGLIRMKQARYAEAREALERAVAGDPGSPKAHYQLSLACARLGDEAGARKHVELYQARLKEIEARVNQINAATGLAAGSGMGP